MKTTKKPNIAISGLRSHNITLENYSNLLDYQVQRNVYRSLTFNFMMHRTKANTKLKLVTWLMFDHRRLLLEVQVEKSTGSFDCSVTRCLNTLQDSFPSLSSKLPIEALRNTVFQIRTLQHGHRTIREIGSQKFALFEKTSNKLYLVFTCKRLNFDLYSW